jgi:NitT/TauT family transport system substrate-binding protein
MSIKASCSRRQFLTAAGATGATISVAWSLGSQAAAQTPGTLTIRQDWIHGGHHAAMWVALDKGWYGEKSLNVSIVRGFGSADTAKMIGIGKEQLGQCDAGAVILAQLKGTEQKIVGSYIPIAPYCLVSPIDKGIRMPKDLEGKTVAVSAATGEYTVWQAFLKKTQVKESAINLNIVSVDLLNTQLLTGKVDAVLTYAISGVALAKVNNLPINVIMFKDHGVDLYSNSLTVYTPWLAEKGNEELLRRFLEATYRGLKYALLNPTEAMAIVAKRNPDTIIGEREQRYQLERLRIWAAGNITADNKKFGLGYISEEKMRYTNDVITEYVHKGPEPKLSLDRIYTNKYLPDPMVTLTAMEWDKINQLYQDYVKLLNI